ncbi:zinc ribbon domain-containing protein [Lentzea sp. NPDC004782]|uniref:FmdB family zinc ribbon protein n=1 Tax=Lentzea sp. NPDC004782 TaxID=3154458 RepID=UPI0033A138A4
MPTYEFRCRTCDDTFELQRPMSESSAPASCPDGHADTVKLLSMAGISGTRQQPAQGGGGCCGGGCYGS